MKNNNQPTQTVQFVKKVATTTSRRERGLKFQFDLADDGQKYKIASYDRHYTSSLKEGDVVFIAKMRKNLKSEDFIWDIYSVKLCTYPDYPNVVKTWFKNETYLII